MGLLGELLYMRAPSAVRPLLCSASCLQVSTALNEQQPTVASSDHTLRMAEQRDGDWSLGAIMEPPTLNYPTPDSYVKNIK